MSSWCDSLHGVNRVIRVQEQKNERVGMSSQTCKNEPKMSGDKCKHAKQMTHTRHIPLRRYDAVEYNITLTAATSTVYFHNYLSGTTFSDESTSPTPDITSPCSAPNCPNSPVAREGAFQSNLTKGIQKRGAPSIRFQRNRVAAFDDIIAAQAVYIMPPMMP